MGLVHTQKIEAQSEKPTWTKALEFTQFACPCGTDPRLLSGEQRTSHFKLVTSVSCGGLNRSTQHFILEGKMECSDGSGISSRVHGG